jgi:hypothetical protein
LVCFVLSCLVLSGDVLMKFLARVLTGFWKVALAASLVEGSIQHSPRFPSWASADCLQVNLNGCEIPGSLVILHDLDPHAKNGANERLFGIIEQLLLGGCSVEVIIRKLDGGAIPPPSVLQLQHDNVSLSWDDKWLSRTLHFSEEERQHPSIIVSTLWFWHSVVAYVNQSSLAFVPSIPSLVNKWIIQIEDECVESKSHIVLADDIHHRRLKSWALDAELLNMIERDERSAWEQASLSVFLSEDDAALARAIEPRVNDILVPLSFRSSDEASRIQVRKWEGLQHAGQRKIGFCGPFHAANEMAIQQLMAVDTIQVRIFWESCTFYFMCDDRWKDFILGLSDKLLPVPVKVISETNTMRMIRLMDIMVVPIVVETVGYSWEVFKAIEWGVPFVTSEYGVRGIPFDRGCKETVAHETLSKTQCIGLFVVPQTSSQSFVASSEGRSKQQKHLQDLILHAQYVLENARAHFLQQQIITLMRQEMKPLQTSSTSFLLNGKVASLLKHVSACGTLEINSDSSFTFSGGPESEHAQHKKVNTDPNLQLRIKRNESNTILLRFDLGKNGKSTTIPPLQVDNWARKYRVGYWQASHILSISCLHFRIDCGTTHRLPEIIVQLNLEEEPTRENLAEINSIGENVQIALVVQPLEEPAEAIENFARRVQRQGYKFDEFQLYEVLSKVCEVKECLRLSSQVAVELTDGAFGKWKSKTVLAVKPWEEPADIVEEFVQDELHNDESFKARHADDENQTFLLMRKMVELMCEKRFCRRSIENVLMETTDVGQIVIKPWEDPADAISRTISPLGLPLPAFYNIGDRRLQELWGQLCQLKVCKKGLSCTQSQVEQNQAIVCTPSVQEPLKYKYTFEILGMYNSGTHFLKSMLELNCDCAAVKPLGWKHRLPPDYVHSKTVIITKHPATWIRSLRSYPYECLWSKSITDDVIICEIDDKCSIIRTFSTVMEWWNVQNSGYLSLREATNVKIIRYEDLISKPEECMKSICSFITDEKCEAQEFHTLGASATYWKDDAVDLRASHSKYLSPDAHIRAMDKLDYDVFQQYINISVANALGYSVESGVASGLL